MNGLLLIATLFMSAAQFRRHYFPTKAEPKLGPLIIIPRPSVGS